MLDMCARAMLDVDHPEASDSSKHDYWEIYGTDYQHHARAVLQALLNPTEDMIEAGKPWAGVSGGSAHRTFAAMIRKALSDE